MIRISEMHAAENAKAVWCFEFWALRGLVGVGNRRVPQLRLVTS